MEEYLQNYLQENVNYRPQIIDLLYNFSFSLLRFTYVRFHNPNQQNLYKILTITSKRLINQKYPSLGGSERSNLITNFLAFSRRLINNYFMNREDFYRNDDILREYLIEEFIENYCSTVRNNMENSSDEDKKIILWICGAIIQEYNPESPTNRSYPFNYFLIENNLVNILNYNCNNLWNTDFISETINKTIYELGNTWTPIERKNEKQKREQRFIFWGLGDFLVRLGIGFWSPYFSQKNNYKYREIINVDLVIPEVILQREIIGNFTEDSIILEEPPPQELFEPSHNWIKEYLCENISLIEEKLECDIVDPIQKEYNTHEVGIIDILLKDNEGNHWVLEIKQGSANHSAMGQILGYMNWAERNLKGQVRGILIVGNATLQLRAAFNGSNRQNIEIWEYNVSEGEHIELTRIQ